MTPKTVDDSAPEQEDKDITRCSNCGLEQETENLNSHLLRGGIKVEKNPLLFRYQKVYFCDKCLAWHRKKDQVERVMAVVGLVLVISLTLSVLVLALL